MQIHYYYYINYFHEEKQGGECSYTFNQLGLAEDCSYLQPQIILKDESGFLEILQSVFVCFILRFDHWNMKNKRSVKYSHSLLFNSYDTPFVSLKCHLTCFSLGLFFFKLLNLLDDVLFLHLLLLNLRHHFGYGVPLLFQCHIFSFQV